MSKREIIREKIREAAGDQVCHLGFVGYCKAF